MQLTQGRHVWVGRQAFFVSILFCGLAAEAVLVIPDTFKKMHLLLRISYVL